MNKLIILVFLLTGGCSSLQTLAKLSSSQVGCPKEEIVIENVDQGLDIDSWSAQCRGKRFICTRTSGGFDLVTQCKEEIKK